MSPALITSAVMVARSSSPTPAPNPASKGVQSAYVDILLAWSSGFFVAGLVVLMLIVICNFKRHNLLHKLIFLEMFLCVWRGIDIFFDDPVYDWYLSFVDIFLYMSYFLHNIVAWMKIRPFLKRNWSIVYLSTLSATVIYWAFDAWALFEHENDLGNDHFKQIRPWEVFAREPWWIFTDFFLIYVLKKRYSCGILEIARTSPRFGVLLFCIIVSFSLVMTDLVASWVNLNGTSGVNPFWPISVVFKYAADTIFLDDFKVVLNALLSTSMGKVGAQGRSGQNSYGLSSVGLGSGQNKSGLSNHESNGGLFHFNKNGAERISSARVDSVRSPPSAVNGLREKVDQRLFTRRTSRNDSGDSQIHLETTVTVESAPVTPENDDEITQKHFRDLQDH